MRTEILLDRLMRVGNPRLFGWGIVALRIAVGVQLLMAGVAKFGAWSAAGYLNSATGPLAGWFQSMAGSPLVDALNAWGLTLIGLALIAGFLVRPASLAGIVVMALYYLSDFVGNTAHGYVDEHIILIIILAIFATGGTGHMAGVNGIVVQSLRKPSAFLRFLLG